jgi:Domain of unknown function (DUF1990)
MPWPDIGIRDAGIEARLAALRELPLNFDPADLGGPGWLPDDYRRPLPAEPPGPPVPGGSWETAVHLSTAYAFADPAIVEGHFDPETPFVHRDMLLVLKAAGLRLYAGVRVGAAGDETREVDGRMGRVSYWNYRTLQGHIEAGQRDYEVWKWLETGEVEFRTHAFSRPAESNVVVQAGFQLLGRQKQAEFGRRACDRMLLLTTAALRRGDGGRAEGAFDGRLLAIYLQDHRAMLVAGRELAGRMGRSGQSDAERDFAREIRVDLVDDLAALDALLARLGRRPDRARSGAAWLAEKAGRLKLNGHVVQRSPLSAVTELEGCRLLLESVRALWTGLAAVALGPDDAATRGDRALRHLDTAERLRAAAVERAILPA